MEHVLEWSNAVLLKKYPERQLDDVGDNITRHLIDGSILMQLTPAEWQEVVPLLGPRKTLTLELQRLIGPTSRWEADESPNLKPPVDKGPRAALMRTRSKIHVARAMAAFKRDHAPARSRTEGLAEGEERPLPDLPHASSIASHGNVLRNLMNMRGLSDFSSVHASEVSNARPLASPRSSPSPPQYVSPRRRYSGLSALSVIDTQSRDSKDSKPYPAIASASRVDDLEASTKSQNVADFLSHKRPGEQREAIMMIPRQADSIFEDSVHLFRRSAFCNLPLVDCGYEPYGFLAMSSLERWRYHVKHFLCQLLFFTDTIFHIFRLKDLGFCAVLAVAVWLCYRHEWYLNIQPTVFLNTLLFPLSFAVNAAYQRRECGLQHFANFKAGVLSLCLLHRGWRFEPNLPTDFLDCSRDCIHTAFGAARAYLMARNEVEKHQSLKLFYETVAEITLLNDVLRLSDVPPPLVAAAVRDLKEAMGAFEALRAYADYRTPSTIRIFIHLLIYLIPLVLTPYFAHLATQGHPALAIAGGALIALPFLLLNNLQRSLENPFAGDHTSSDPDDIRLDEMQLMSYIKEDADAAVQLHAEARRMSQQPPEADFPL